MKKLLSSQMAGHLMIVCLSLVLIFHTLILLGFIPYSIVWGGKLESVSQVWLFEMISIAINLLFLLAVLTKMGYTGKKIPIKVVTIAMWVMTGVFLLNTLGNLYSENDFEKLVFTPITFLLALLCLRLALDRKKQ